MPEMAPEGGPLFDGAGEAPAESDDEGALPPRPHTPNLTLETRGAEAEAQP
jgi:hypothetical protein